MKAKLPLRKVKTFTERRGPDRGAELGLWSRIAILECGHEKDMGGSGNIPNRMACAHCGPGSGQPRLV